MLLYITRTMLESLGMYVFLTVHELSELQPRVSCVRVQLCFTMSPNLASFFLCIFPLLTVNCHKSSPLLVLFSYGSVSLKFLSELPVF